MVKQLRAISMNTKVAGRRPCSPHYILKKALDQRKKPTYPNLLTPQQNSHFHLAQPILSAKGVHHRALFHVADRSLIAVQINHDLLQGMNPQVQYPCRQPLIAQLLQSSKPLESINKLIALLQGNHHRENLAKPAKGVHHRFCLPFQSDSYYSLHGGLLSSFSISQSSSIGNHSKFSNYFSTHPQMRFPSSARKSCVTPVGEEGRCAPPEKLSGQGFQQRLKSPAI